MKGKGLAVCRCAIVALFGRLVWAGGLVCAVLTGLELLGSRVIYTDRSGMGKLNACKRVSEKSGAVCTRAVDERW